jgi:hypothetical protein
MGLELFQTLLQQASAQGSRSTALQPLIWLSSLFLVALVSSVSVHAPAWVVVALCSGTGVILVTFVFAYLFFVLKNPDALRSERFTLTKMQIEKNQLGDTIRGFGEATPAIASETSPAPAPGLDGASW